MGGKFNLRNNIKFHNGKIKPVTISITEPFFFQLFYCHLYHFLLTDAQCMLTKCSWEIKGSRKELMPKTNQIMKDKRNNKTLSFPNSFSCRCYSTLQTNSEDSNGDPQLFIFTFTFKFRSGLDVTNMRRTWFVY